MLTPVVQEALSRIAWVFRMRVEDLDLKMRFGTDLKASFVSDWTENEFDKLYYDVLEMREHIGVRNVCIDEVCTVGDFCALAEQYRNLDFAGYCQLLKQWEKEKEMCRWPRWKRFLFAPTGLIRGKRNRVPNL
ncbi:MAG: hypothetical protein L6455_04730 [Kiritimatiellae bacterium]|nr:hypothetical protein [Kiritimatiellia bacterium]